jgi:hypothetical protein
MARKNFPLRIDAEILDAVRRWADDDLRSLNGQIEFLLRESLRGRGRIKDAIAATELDSTDVQVEIPSSLIDLTKQPEDEST